MLGKIVWVNWLSNCAAVSLARGVSRVGERGSGGCQSWWGIGCGEGRTVLGMLCGGRNLGDLFQSDSSVVELIGRAGAGGR